jgi:hypothetical protein
MSPKTLLRPVVLTLEPRAITITHSLLRTQRIRRINEDPRIAAEDCFSLPAILVMVHRRMLSSWPAGYGMRGRIPRGPEIP